MRTLTAMLILTTLFMALPRVCLGWDFAYEGDDLPNDPALGANAWSVRPSTDQGVTGHSSASGGFLRLLDQWSDQAALFYRDDVAPGSPVTIEVRVRVVSADDPYNGLVEPLRFGGRLAFVGVWSDRIGVRYIGMNNFTFHSLDMSEFHVLRLAIEGAPQPYTYPSLTVWADGVQVFSGLAPGVVGGSVHFGTSYVAPTSESYWDYVRYSSEYLPVPEPSSLVALALGLSGLAAMRRRR